MKIITKILFIGLVTIASHIKTNNAEAQSASVSLSVFQNSLSPYGRWVNNGNYGQVWVANDRSFRPYYTGGHWAYTNDGWTWVSDYDWGWAPFHYGRWNYEPSLGWYWVPGYEWAPAWVAWRSSGDYYGWAPLAPGLTISAGGGYDNGIPYQRWVFTPHQYITNPDVNRYYEPGARNVTIIKNTTVINNVNVRNNVNYVAGPRRADVERINHTTIRTYSVANSAKPGRTVVNNNTINVYRPVINKTTVNNNKTVINNNKTTVNRNTAVNNHPTIVNNNAPKKPVNANVHQPATPNHITTKQPAPVNRNIPKPNNQVMNAPNHPAIQPQPQRNIPHQNRQMPNRPAPQPRMNPQPQHTAPQPHPAPPDNNRKPGNK